MASERPDIEDVRKRALTWVSDDPYVELIAMCDWASHIEAAAREEAGRLQKALRKIAKLAAWGEASPDDEARARFEIVRLEAQAALTGPAQGEPATPADKELSLSEALAAAREDLKEAVALAASSQKREAEWSDLTSRAHDERDAAREEAGRLRAGEDLGLRQFRRVNVARCEGGFAPLDSWSGTDWGCALAGEVGEACNLLKKARRGTKIDIEALADELADVFTYLDLLAARHGIDLAEAVVRKFNDVSCRADVDSHHVLGRLLGPPSPTGEPEGESE